MCDILMILKDNSGHKNWPFEWITKIFTNREQPSRKLLWSQSCWRLLNWTIIVTTPIKICSWLVTLSLSGSRMWFKQPGFYCNSFVLCRSLRSTTVCRLICCLKVSEKARSRYLICVMYHLVYLSVYWSVRSWFSSNNPWYSHSLYSASNHLISDSSILNSSLSAPLFKWSWWSCLVSSAGASITTPPSRYHTAAHASVVAILETGHGHVEHSVVWGHHSTLGWNHCDHHTALHSSHQYPRRQCQVRSGAGIMCS